MQQCSAWCKVAGFIGLPYLNPDVHFNLESESHPPPALLMLLNPRLLPIQFLLSLFEPVRLYCPERTELMLSSVRGKVKVKLEVDCRLRAA